MLRLILSLYCIPRALPSFPTRRSSDLFRRQLAFLALALGVGDFAVGPLDLFEHFLGAMKDPDRQSRRPQERSEEHTSELQSLTKLVCLLLLEKKKITIRNIPITYTQHC